MRSDSPDIAQLRSSFLRFRINAGVLIHPNYKQARIYFASSLQIFSLRTSHFGGFQQNWEVSGFFLFVCFLHVTHTQTYDGVPQGWDLDLQPQK